MSDSSIKLRQDEERQALFKEQSEWYRLNGGKLLCDCTNCINARDLKAATNQPHSTFFVDVYKKYNY